LDAAEDKFSLGKFSLGKMPRASLLPRCNFNLVCRHAVTKSVKVGDVAQQQQREIDLHRSIAAAESRGSEGAHQSRESPSVADSTGSWPTERRPYTRAIEGIKALLNDGVAFTRRCFGGLAVENLHHSAVISDKPCSLHRTSGKRYGGAIDRHDVGKKFVRVVHWFAFGAIMHLPIRGNITLQK
jgi:hypothetical protein